MCNCQGIIISFWSAEWISQYVFSRREPINNMYDEFCYVIREWRWINIQTTIPVDDMSVQLLYYLSPWGVRLIVRCLSAKSLSSSCLCLPVSMLLNAFFIVWLLRRRWLVEWVEWTASVQGGDSIVCATDVMISIIATRQFGHLSTRQISISITSVFIFNWNRSSWSCVPLSDLMTTDTWYAVIGQ